MCVPVFDTSGGLSPAETGKHKPDKKRNRSDGKSGGTLIRLCLPDFSRRRTFSDLHIFVYDIFFACAIVSGEASPISAPSCHILKPRAKSKRISLLVSSLIRHITSSPFISLSIN